MVILSLVQFEKKKEAFWHFVQISTLKLLHLFLKKNPFTFNIYCIMTHVLVVI